MDKNQATGLILIALMLITYFTFFKPEVPEQPAEEMTTSEQPVVSQDTTVVSHKVEALPDSLISVENNAKYGIFAAGANGQSELTTLENDVLKIELDTKGAAISSVVLKNFNSKDDKPVKLITPTSNEISILAASFGKTINISELYYQVSTSSNSDTNEVTYTLDLGNGQEIAHKYSLPVSGYELSYNVEFKGLNDKITKDELTFQWNEQMLTQEKDVNMSRQNSTVNFFTASGEWDELTERSLTYEEETINEPIKWTTIKQRFFLSAIIADKSFTKGKFTTNVDENNPEVVKRASVTLGIPFDDVKNGDASFRFYFGPNDYHITSDVAEEFSKNLFLGWPPMLWVNKFVLIPLFDFLNNFISNYGLIIILIVFVIKLALSPLSYKSYLSMAKMKVLKPELDEIKEKHDGDMTKAQQDQMKLYQQVGVNPISGCLPLLLQMPILLAMFYFFPQSIELRGESFLWADDLSNYDSIINLPFEIPFYGDHVSLFVLLMTFSTILITYSQQQVSSVQGPMKSLSYMMPVIFMFVLNSYPAALSFYYFVSNLVTFGQQVLIRRFVDEDKIRQILEENKKNAGSRKKSKFQQRLEDAMKAQTKNQSKK